jgi:hypothetical protein
MFDPPLEQLAPAEDEPPVPPPPPPQGSMLKSALGAARSSVAIMNAAPAAELEGSDDVRRLTGLGMT